MGSACALQDTRWPSLSSAPPLVVTQQRLPSARGARAPQGRARAAAATATMADVFSGRVLVTRDGGAVEPDDVLQNKVVALFFSAAWCPPCRDFTARLRDFYTGLVEHTRPAAPFQIVFISCDRTAEEMLDYMHHMPGEWLALPFHDPFKHDLKKKYNITAIPKLVVVKQTGEVITDKGRKQIREQGLSCFQNWLEGADIFQNFSG